MTIEHATYTPPKSKNGESLMVSGASSDAGRSWASSSAWAPCSVGGRTTDRRTIGLTVPGRERDPPITSYWQPSPLSSPVPLSVRSSEASSLLAKDCRHSKRENAGLILLKILVLMGGTVLIGRRRQGVGAA